MKARIGWLPGDGVGPEVLREARRVLDVIAGEHNHEFEYVEADIGGVAIERHGQPLPEATQDVCLRSDAVFLGAVVIPSSIICRPGKNAKTGCSICGSCWAITRISGRSLFSKLWSTVRPFAAIPFAEST